jgi:formylglycine-generating enzyme required for sulfatase activity
MGGITMKRKILPAVLAGMLAVTATISGCSFSLGEFQGELEEMRQEFVENMQKAGEVIREIREEVEEEDSGPGAFFEKFLERIRGAPGGQTTREAGDEWVLNASGVTIRMRYVPETPNFPISPEATAASGYVEMADTSFASVAKPFWIAQTEVTYQQWYTVAQWALANGYAFQNPGKEGSEGPDGIAPSGTGNEPVTEVNFRDVIVWLNALSEMDGKTPVYQSASGVILRDSGDQQALVLDGAVQSPGDGYRLPINHEWELAARWIDGVRWTPGNYASAAENSYLDAASTGAVAWYTGNSGGKTQEVGLKAPNALGLYDLCGNVTEWVFDRIQSEAGDASSLRAIRGGSWANSLSHMQLGAVTHCGSDAAWNTIGFRIVRNALPGQSPTSAPTIDVSPALNPTLTQAPVTATPTETAAQIDAMNPGDLLIFGRYEQDNDLSNGKEKLSWIILEVDRGGNRVLVISEKNLDAVPYHSQWTQITWEDSDIRNFLNTNFMDAAFTPAEQSMIQEISVVHYDHPTEGTPGGNTTQDKIFLLSFYELYTYLPDNQARRAENTPYARARGATDEGGYGWWWLRSPGANSQLAARVAPDGTLNEGGILVTFIENNIRPVMWIDLSS